MAGPVIFELVDTLYQDSLIIGNIPGLSPINTLTIKPQAGKQVKIKSSKTYAIKLFNTHDIIIDGSGDGSGSKDLTILISATTGLQAPIHIASAGVGQGCKRITIKNVNIEAGHSGYIYNYVTYTSSGIFIGASAINTAGYDNDSIIINNVHIRKAYYGVYSYGNSATNPNKRVYITNSTIGANNTANYITQSGVYLYYTINSRINNNNILNFN